MAKQIYTRMSMQGMILSLPYGGKVLNFFHSPERENHATRDDSLEFFKSAAKFYIREPGSSERVKNCLDFMAFRDVLTECLADTGGKLYDSCVSYRPGEARDTPELCQANSFSKGLMLSCENKLCPDNAERIITEAISKSGQAVNSYVKYTDKDNVEWFLVAIKGNDSTVVEKGVLCSAPMPLFHPGYIQPGHSALFHSYQDAKDVMIQVGTENALCFVNKIKSIAEKDSVLEDVTSVARQYPLIVIEGLDGTGKSTLAACLSRRINGVDFHTPSEDLMLWRPYFDPYPELIRRAYFTLCNYVSANQIANELKNRPVVIDRYWHTTAAYTMAKDVSPWGVSALPPKGHWVYRWPSDLLRPSIVLYLYAPEELRCQRLTGRNEGLTPEELKLSHIPTLRDTLDQAYKWMENPHVTVIDASGSREDVLQNAMVAVSASIENGSICSISDPHFHKS